MEEIRFVDDTIVQLSTKLRVQETIDILTSKRNLQHQLQPHGSLKYIDPCVAAHQLSDTHTNTNLPATN